MPRPAVVDGDIRSAALRRLVLPGETVVVAVHKHWSAVAEPVASAVVTIVVVAWLTSLIGDGAGWVGAVLWLGALAAAARAAWRLAEWRREWFVATDKRLIKTSGLLTHKVGMLPLGKVTDMSYQRSVAGRVLGFGTFVLESAGQDQAMRTIEYVVRPDETYRRICDTLFGDSVAPGPGVAAGRDRDGQRYDDDVDRYAERYDDRSAARRAERGPVTVGPVTVVPVTVVPGRRDAARTGAVPGVLFHDERIPASPVTAPPAPPPGPPGRPERDADRASGPTAELPVRRDPGRS